MPQLVGLSQDPSIFVQTPTLHFFLWLQVSPLRFLRSFFCLSMSIPFAERSVTSTWGFWLHRKLFNRIRGETPAENTFLCF